VTRTDRTFAALADPTRRAILARLAEGEATVLELVGRFDLTQPTISSHLKVLHRADLISRSRRGQTRPCKLAPKGFQEIDRWLEPFRRAMEANYTRLDRLLATLQQPPRKEKRKR
jgi:DNA-binding transcriptional ArsR family regulator